MLDIMACLAPCFGSAPVVAPSDERVRAKYVTRLRTNLGIREPREHSRQPQEQPPRVELSLPSVPALTYSTSLRDRTGRAPIPVKPTVPWSDTVMNDEEITDLFNRIDCSMAHVRYAICGMGALHEHGFRGRRVNKVTVLVPQESKDVVRSWALAQGGILSEGHDDSIGVRMRDGTVRRLRVKYLPDRFERLDIARSRHSDAKVLSLPSQLEHITEAYLQEIDKARLSDRVPDKDNGTVRIIVGDIFWILRRALDTNTPMPEAYLTAFLSAKFWDVFGEQYSEAKAATARANINIAAVLERHRDIGDHEALLVQHGLIGMGVVDHQPGLFEGMRGLGSGMAKPSVYTLRSNRDSASETWMNEPLPTDAATVTEPIYRGKPLPTPIEEKRQKADMDDGAKRPKTMKWTREGRDKVGAQKMARSRGVKPPRNEMTDMVSMDYTKGQNTPQGWL